MLVSGSVRSQRSPEKELHLLPGPPNKPAVSPPFPSPKDSGGIIRVTGFMCMTCIILGAASLSKTLLDSLSCRHGIEDSKQLRSGPASGDMKEMWRTLKNASVKVNTLKHSWVPHQPSQAPSPRYPNSCRTTPHSFLVHPLSSRALFLGVFHARLCPDFGAKTYVGLLKFNNYLLKVQHASDASDRQLMHTLIWSSFCGHTRSILLRLGSTWEEGHVKGLYIITFSYNSICKRYTTLYICNVGMCVLCNYSHFMDLSTEILICPDDTEGCQTFAASLWQTSSIFFPPRARHHIQPKFQLWQKTNCHPGTVWEKCQLHSWPIWDLL